eukprot:Blabericola_migrator_1__9523@NODE_517_length_7921_cov_221_621976_g395_i0_p7_GENE_NODE_517_length_7921_cov_221_621976_g395_i0NODE_517_length_7921_cov_221_621976_g395_i0_p7_ORF_typecomplete_len154_score22_73_NODE_517_length_7921_cov_221_621976_g395_i066807141
MRLLESLQTFLSDPNNELSSDDLYAKQSLLKDLAEALNLSGIKKQFPSLLVLVNDIEAKLNAPAAGVAFMQSQPSQSIQAPIQAPQSVHQPPLQHPAAIRAPSWNPWFGMRPHPFASPHYASRAFAGGRPFPRVASYAMPPYYPYPRYTGQGS